MNELAALDQFIARSGAVVKEPAGQSRPSAPVVAATGVTAVAVAAAGREQSLPDISNRFTFKERWRAGSFEYEQISGQLGVPGAVMVHRDKSEQERISKGTGEHAGHRIGVQFGAPGDARNMSLQNPNINSYKPKHLRENEGLEAQGGDYLKMEMEWAEKLKRGYQIHVTVRDKYRPGDNRPIGRQVTWTETMPKGMSPDEDQTHAYVKDFGNFASPQQKEALGIRGGNQE